MKKEVREKVWKKYDCKCAYCGEDLEFDNFQVDHIEPKYLGGKDDIKNYNPSCRQCNFYKSTFSLDQFKKQLTTITERIKKPFIVRLALKYGIISFKPFDGEFYFEKLNKALPINSVLKPLKDKEVISFEDWRIDCDYYKTVAGNFVKGAVRYTEEEARFKYKTEYLKSL